jgi:protein SCO1/2
MLAGAAAWWLALAPAMPASAQVPKLGFVPPAPRTYRLEHIMRAPEGVVLDSDGSTHRFSEFSTGKVTLFSFIYTYCTDPNGCPLAYATLHELKRMIEQDARLRGLVRFVSMSFDPRHDTPPAMRSYGGQDARDQRGLRWHFLTTSSGRQLAPLLEGFGQDVAVAAEQPTGQRVPVLSHLLKVYLIDAGGSVREIYSTAFLHPAVLLNDIKTLLLEPAAPRK